MFRVRLLGLSLVTGLVALGALSPTAGLTGAHSILIPSRGISYLFDTWTGYQSGRFLSAVVPADFNRDGYTDVAWARNDFSGNTMNVQLNQGRGTMGAAVTYPATSQSNDIATGDLDRDADADLVVVSQGDNLANTIIDVYINGNGTFTRRTVAGGSGPTKVVLADLDGDADLDLALSNYWSANGTMSVLMNNGAGMFGPQTLYPVAFRPNGLAAADLDGDGDRDLAVGRPDTPSGSVKVHLFLNDGGGSFSPVQPLTVTIPAEDPVLTAADLDRDGDQDMAVGGIRTDQISVLLNQGNLSFSQQPYEAGFSSFNIVVADPDADGDLDLVSATPGDEISGVSLLRNTGNGTFGPVVLIEAGYLPQDVDVADFNKDGRADLAVANRGTNTGSFHPQRADGSFANAVLYDNDSYLPLAVASADFDGDGDVDMAESSDQVHVMKNQGNGDFVLSSSIPSGGGLIHGIVASDLNGDDRPDLLWAPDDPPYPYVYALNNGDGSFGPIVKRNIQTCGTGDATTADVDNDGDQDVMVANNRGGPGCEPVDHTPSAWPETTGGRTLGRTTGSRCSRFPRWPSGPISTETAGPT